MNGSQEVGMLSRKLYSFSPWRVIGRLFGEAMDRSGLKDSILSQCQRIACVCVKDKAPAPEPGTPLLVDLFGVVEHSGIYLGNGRVAELFGDNLLREVTLKEFLEGEKGAWVRTGRRIFAACSRSSGKILASPYAAENARAFIRRIRTVRYNLFRNNCHLFSISCISGSFQNGISLAEGIVRGGVSIGVLTNAIAHFLNNGVDVVWKPVEGWDRKTLRARVIEDGSERACTEAIQSKVKEMERGRRKCAVDEAKLEATIKKASAGGGVFGPCCEYVRLAFSTIKDCVSGKRKDIPWSDVCWIVAALLYFISPLDLIPDLVPVVGYGDDAMIFLRALWGLLPYVDIPLEVVARVMQIDGRIAGWIRDLGESGGRLADETFESEVRKDFDVSASLLEYYGRRFDLALPFKIESSAKAASAASPWKEWPGCDDHHWRLQASKLGLGARICDPFGNSCFWGRKIKVRHVYEQFIKWYEDELLPRILNEKPGELPLATSRIG